MSFIEKAALTNSRCSVDAFHDAGLQAGGVSYGAPGPRPEYTAGYYAAFVRDPEGNRIEAVTFTQGRG